MDPGRSWHARGWERTLSPLGEGPVPLRLNSRAALPQPPPAAPMPWQAPRQPACRLIGRAEPGQMAAGEVRTPRPGLAGPASWAPALDWEIPGAWSGCPGLWAWPEGREGPVMVGECCHWALQRCQPLCCWRGWGRAQGESFLPGQRGQPVALGGSQVPVCWRGPGMEGWRGAAASRGNICRRSPWGPK